MEPAVSVLIVSDYASGETRSWDDVRACFFSTGDSYGLKNAGMRAVHAFEGWSMEADLRRNAGYATVIVRLRDGRLPYTGLIRLGPIAVPSVAGGKILYGWGYCWRCGKSYGPRVWELPLVLFVSVVMHCLEIPGMSRAYGGRRTPESAYR